MIPGLSGEETRAFKDAARAPGADVRTRARVLTLDHKPLHGLDIQGGQVRWNRAADVVTEASVRSSDSRDALELDLRHLVRVDMGVMTDTHGLLWCPTITGWVVAPSDSGDEAEFTLHDKSAMGLFPSRRGKAGANLTVARAIKQMWEEIGETRFDIPRRLLDDGPKLGRVVQWGGPNPKKSRTAMCKRLARAHNMQWGFDGAGTMFLRRFPQQPGVSWTADTDSDGQLLDEIAWSRDLTKVRNRVIGRGRKVGPVVAEAPPSHVFSPRNLKRGPDGDKVPMHLNHYFRDESIDKRPDLVEATEKALRRLLIDRAEVQLQSTVVPWADAYALYHAERADGRWADFWMREGSMELDWSGMQVGRQHTWRPRRG